jgi:hypothetical protein
MTVTLYVFWGSDFQTHSVHYFVKRHIGLIYAQKEIAQIVPQYRFCWQSLLALVWVPVICQRTEVARSGMLANNTGAQSILAYSGVEL